MRHECKITVLETKVFSELQKKYLADPKSGPCPFFKPGDTFLLKRTQQQDDFYHLMNESGSCQVLGTPVFNLLSIFGRYKQREGR